VSSSRFYVILDFPDEGSLVLPYEDMAKAKLEYRDGLARLHKGEIQGLAVVYGQVVRSVGSLASLKPKQVEDKAQDDLKPVDPRKNLPKDLLDPFADGRRKQ
jgi:hypothetical protein